MPIGIYSTITNDVKYCEYNPPPHPKAIPTLKRYVLIAGGAGRAQMRTFITPLGVRTEVSQEQLDFLLANESFKRHQAAGFIKVVKSKAEADKVAADMSQRDGSAPMVPNDYKQAPKLEAGKQVSDITTAPRYQSKKVAGGF